MLVNINKTSYLLASLAFSSLVEPQYVTRNGLQFQHNGTPYTFAGANMWPITFQGPEYVKTVISGATKGGFPILRIAAWNEKDLAHGKNPGDYFFQEWNGATHTINDGPNGFGLLDSAVQQAEAAGIHLIVCLTNNWLDYGGMDTYIMNILGEQDFTHTNFYTNTQIKDAWKTYVAHVVNRYKNSPAIFSWELANEARCQESNCAGGVLTKWADEMSQYIKSLDSHHMVTFGGYGYFNYGKTDIAASHDYDFNYDGDSGEDYNAIIALPGIDFGTVHHYTVYDTSNTETYGLQWLKDHNAASVKANKPMVVEELGVNRTSPGMSMVDVLQSYETYIASADANAIQGVLLWSCDVVGGSCPFQGDPFAICQGDDFYTKLVTDFVKTMAKKSGS